MIKRFITRIRVARCIWRKRPVITISDHGWKTPNNHQISIGVTSRSGATTIRTYQLNSDEAHTFDSVHAQLEQHARSIANITGLPVIDERPTTDSYYRRSAPRDWRWFPRDQDGDWTGLGQIAADVLEKLGGGAAA